MSVTNLLLFISHNLVISIAGIFGLGLLIGIHELGHFLFCKLFNVHTPTFSIGFGPQLIKKKIGDTEFSLSAIPIGGYVEIAGSKEFGQGEQKEADRNDQYSFAIKPYYQKILIMGGGILFNFLFAYCTLILLFAMGLPKTEMLYPLNATPTIELVEEGSSAYQAGLQKGDRILSFDRQPIDRNTKQLIEKIQSHADQSVNLIIERDGKQRDINFIIEKKQFMGKTIGSLGVVFQITELPAAPFFKAVKQGIQTTNRYIYNTIHAFKYIFVKRDVSKMGGPLLIISETIKGAAKGIKIFLLFLAILSINLAILNLIPLPILDGGQILFYTIEAIIRRPIPIRIREYIHIASWILFLLLIVYLSAKDIWRIMNPYFTTILKELGFK